MLGHPGYVTHTLLWINTLGDRGNAAGEEALTSSWVRPKWDERVLGTNQSVFSEASSSHESLYRNRLIWNRLAVLMSSLIKTWGTWAR